MAPIQSSWLKAWFRPWLKLPRAARSRKKRTPFQVSLGRHLEHLEDRAMLSGVSVNFNTSNLAVNATAIVINGSGFDPIVTSNSVSFNDGAVGTVTGATSTSLIVAFSTEPSTAGNLTAVVTSDGVSSGAAVQVAALTPVVTSSAANLPANATTATINGFGFDTAAGHNTVVFNDGAVGTVTAASATSLTVALSTDPTNAGSLTAVVTTDSVSNSAPVQVAAVTPVVSSNTSSLAAGATTVTINGFGFDTTAGNNTVAFDEGAVGTVTAATATSLTVVFSTNPPTAGNLDAVVTSDGVSSGVPVPVATITPVVTSSTANLAAGATTITITGLGFDPIVANNSVSFNNGAVGTITGATATSLTVALSTDPTTAASLTAVVTTDGVSSGVPIQVAAITPVVTNSATSLVAGATTVALDGFGFDPTAGNNTVAFNDGAAGTVTTATPTSLTVTFSAKPSNLGSLTAVVTVDGESSGTAVQVATVIPMVTSNTADLAANATTIIIDGFGFDPTAGNNTVVFNDGVVGTVTSASATSLTVTLSTKPTTAGNLTAVVTTDGESSGAAVQVGAVAPVVTNNTGDLAANATTVTITGFGFDTTVGNNTVAFNDGAIGTVTAATGTSLTVTFSTKPTTAGNLTAVVTVDGAGSGTATQVATVTPIVTSSTTNLAANATAVTIKGFGFDPTAGNNTITFNSGAVGTVTAATATSLTVTFSTKPSSMGSLTAVVTVNGESSGAAAQVGTVTPVVTSSTASLAANATTILITGFGFDSTAASNTVTLSDGAIGAVISATATLLTVNFSTKPTTAGALTAVVTTDGLNNGSAVQVAEVTPVVTSSSASVAANAATITIAGFGFDPTAAYDTITFNDGAVGTVTAAAPNSLTVTFSTDPPTTGSLTAVVTTDGANSGSAVQVGMVTPVVTGSSANLAANAPTIFITGFDFDTTAANNTVALSDGAVGTVTAATATSLTVTFSTKPITAGTLTATVTTDGVNSGSAVQVATVVAAIGTPVVMSSTASLAANANSITINGSGFDARAANDTVSFNDGAVGTVAAATTTSLTVRLFTEPTAPGSLTAVVTTDGVSSGSAVQVATVTPVVTSSTANLAANATTITINGFGFDPTAADNAVAFNDGAVGTVTGATSNSLTVTFSTCPVIAGNLAAVVTSDGMSSGTAVQVATVTPAVTSSAADLAADATTITINGFGFDPTAANNTVTFNDGVVGAVSSATATSLTITFSTEPTSTGNLTAVVTSNGRSSGSAVQVATITSAASGGTINPTVNPTTVTINGAANDDVAITFTDAADFTVTVNGVSTSYSTSAVDKLVYTGPSGAFSKLVFDDPTTTDDYTATQSLDSSDIIGSNGFEFVATGVTNLYVYVADLNSTATVNVANSASSDNFFVGSASGGYSYIADPGNGTYSELSGFPGETVTGSGGATYAYVYSTSHATVTGNAAGSSFSVGGVTSTLGSFPQIYFVGAADGTDSATLDSGGGTFVSTPGFSYADTTLNGSSFLVGALYFANVTGQASSGGADKAIFYSYAHNTFQGAMGTSTLAGSTTGAAGTAYNFLAQATGYQSVTAFESGAGTDAANLTSPGNGQFVSTPTVSTLTVGTSSITVNTYYANSSQAIMAVPSQVSATDSAGGTDTADLYDATGTNALVGQGSKATLTTPISTVVVTSFGTVNAYQTAGTSDTVQQQSVDFTLATVGNWKSV